MSQQEQPEPDGEGEENLGPRPEPEIEPGEPHPGGADAVDGGDGVDTEDAGPDTLPHDMHPDENPAVEGGLPDEMKEGEDTRTQATDESSDVPEVEPEEESPA